MTKENERLELDQLVLTGTKTGVTNMSHQCHTHVTPVSHTCHKRWDNESLELDQVQVQAGTKPAK